ncbi:hypothetical protein [Streptomyces sp. NPDC004528]|uniref:hypothetical protein n=1 Tax=Streptomyces sp. NPDC004528 TaxID=3154550 RepID=UPI0033ACB893
MEYGVPGMGMGNVRVPQSVQEIIDDAEASRALERAIEDGWVAFRVHLRTGETAFSLRSEVSAAAA